MNLDQYAVEIYKDNVDKGFWDDPREFGTILALITSELSEALEEQRDGHAFDEVYYRADGKPEGILVELADAFIRIMDTVGWIMESNIKIDFDAIVDEKLAFNRTRPRMHGKLL